MKKNIHLFHATVIETPLGHMLAIANDKAVYFLAFGACNAFAQDLERFQRTAKAVITLGVTEPLHLLRQELQLYFAGYLKEFKTPVVMLGTPFQQRVWQALREIPWGQTRSYAAIAAAIGRPLSFRAVALANRANRLPLLIACHRVIKADGDLCGYNGGVERKAWLLNHEQSTKHS